MPLALQCKHKMPVQQKCLYKGTQTALLSRAEPIHIFEKCMRRKTKVTNFRLSPQATELLRRLAGKGITMTEAIEQSLIRYACDFEEAKGAWEELIAKLLAIFPPPKKRISSSLSDASTKIIREFEQIGDEGGGKVSAESGKAKRKERVPDR